MKNFKGRITLLGIAAALTVCGCSAGFSAETEAEDNLAHTTEAANDMEQAVETAESENPIVQDMPVWISEETPIKDGYISAESKGGEKGSPIRNMPVIIFDAEPNGEGGLVPTTVIDPDGDDSFERELSEIAED